MNVSYHHVFGWQKRLHNFHSTMNDSLVHWNYTFHKIQPKKMIIVWIIQSFNSLLHKFPKCIYFFRANKINRYCLCSPWRTLYTKRQSRPREQMCTWHKWHMFCTIKMENGISASRQENSVHSMRNVANTFRITHFSFRKWQSMNIFVAYALHNCTGFFLFNIRADSPPKKTGNLSDRKWST